MASIAESDSKVMIWSDSTKSTINITVLKELDSFGAIVLGVKSLLDNALSSYQISHSSSFYI